jgi:hypothetical protein
MSHPTQATVVQVTFQSLCQDKLGDRPEEVMPGYKRRESSYTGHLLHLPRTGRRANRVIFEGYKESYIQS